MKKQLKRISKKILIFSLVGVLVFTSCFSYKKIEVKAASVVGALGAYTLYEICLYLGGLAITALGLGCVYENRDDIAEFGKSVIDSMTDLPEQGWLLGSYTPESSYVYGSEALQEVQDTSWTVIHGGGQSPKNDDDNDDDGDKDADDRSIELDMTGFFLTEIGIQFFDNVIKPIYNDWVNGEEDNPIYSHVGAPTELYFNGTFPQDSQGNYTARLYVRNGSILYDYEIVSSKKIYAKFIDYGSSSGYYRWGYHILNGDSYSIISLRENGLVKDKGIYSGGIDYAVIKSGDYEIYSDVPIFMTEVAITNFKNNGTVSNIMNDVPGKVYRVADWVAENEYWKGYLEGIANSLRSLGDLVNISQQLANSVYNNQPDAIAYGSMMTDLGQEYAPMEYPITDPVYWPDTNPTPKLDPSVLPNYQPGTNPDPGTDFGTDPGTGTDPSDPDDPGGNNPDDIEIDLDGLLSLFTILIYIIMIIIMLIYLFLACLAFIVMIFRIPASSSMLPEEMVMGFEHLQTIMIPGMNISIYDFAMALIYMFIIFAVIKVLRHEINHFKIPRAFK